MKMRSWVPTMMLALALPALVSAQANPPPRRGGPMDGKFWKHERVRQELGLSQQQVDRLEAVFLEHQKKLIDLKADVEKKTLDLHSLSADANASEQDIARMIDQVEDARARLGKARAMMMLAARGVLTPAQREKLERLRERRDERHPNQRPGRPRADGREPLGGPGGPPPDGSMDRDDPEDGDGPEDGMF